MAQDVKPGGSHVWEGSTADFDSVPGLEGLCKKKLLHGETLILLNLFSEVPKGPIKFFSFTYSVLLFFLPGIFLRGRKDWTVNFRIPKHLVVILSTLSVFAVRLHGLLELQPRD